MARQLPTWDEVMEKSCCGEPLTPIEDAASDLLDPYEEPRLSICQLAAALSQARREGLEDAADVAYGSWNRSDQTVNMKAHGENIAEAISKLDATYEANP